MKRGGIGAGEILTGSSEWVAHVLLSLCLAVPGAVGVRMLLAPHALATPSAVAGGVVLLVMTLMLLRRRRTSSSATMPPLAGRVSAVMLALVGGGLVAIAALLMPASRAAGDWIGVACAVGLALLAFLEAALLWRQGPASRG